MKERIGSGDRNRSTLRTLLLLASCVYMIPFAFVSTWLESKDYSTQNRRLLYFGLGACTVSIWMLTVHLVSTYIAPSSGNSLILFLLDLLFLPGGIYLLILYSILMRRNRQIQYCLNLICREHITSVKRLSEIMGLSEVAMRMLLQRILRAELLQDALLPESSDEVLFTRGVWARQHVVCESCGAELIVNFGETLTCDYCGSMLKARRIRRE